MNVNKIIVIGRLGADPTWHKGNSGQFITFSVATTEMWKNKDNSYTPKTQWHKVVIFNEKLAEGIARKCKKGSTVYVEGKLLSREQVSHITKQSSVVFEIVVDKFSGTAFSLSKESDPFDDKIKISDTSIKETKGIFDPSFLDDDEEVPF